MFVARQFVGLQIVSPAAMHAAHTDRRKQQFGKLLKPVYWIPFSWEMTLWYHCVILYVASFAQIFVYICLTNVERLAKTKYF